jgi:hypothetical protein
MNRFCEIGWMTHRLLPLLQPQNVPMPRVWKENWRTLDECFKEAVEYLTKQLGKEIGNVMAEFVRVKFPFNENHSFWV